MSNTEGLENALHLIHHLFRALERRAFRQFYVDEDETLIGLGIKPVGTFWNM